MSDPAEDFGDFMAQMGRVKIAPRYADERPPEAVAGPSYVVRKGLAYWTGAGWSFRREEALAIALDEARRLRDELRARWPGESPEFDPRIEPVP